MNALNKDSVISARGLRKQYGKQVAIDGISFDIAPGRIVGLIGPNGSGKTTTLKAILGLTGFEGELSVLRRDPRVQRDALPSVRQVAADYQLNPITVSRAYQELVDDALVEKRRGLGMYVLDGARDKLLASERERFMREEWPAMLERITQLGLDLDQLLQASRDSGAQGESA